MSEKDLIGTKITAVPKEPLNIGVDTENSFADNILNAAMSSSLDLSAIENFSYVANNRETMYRLIDTMGQDSTIAAIIETYAEYATERNAEGRIVWCESEDVNTQKYITYLLDAIDIDKHIFGWAYSLFKYGDLYLRLYRDSDYDVDDLFDKTEANKLQVLNEGKTLNEDVILKLNKANDHFANYVEAVANPGEMFELTKFGKTMGFIKAPYNVYNTTTDNGSGVSSAVLDLWQYKMTKDDVFVYPATEYVHAILDDNSSRTPEEVSIFANSSDMESNTNANSYLVRSGKSMLYDWFRSWRLMSLIEDSILLNRLTKSSIVRTVQVEVGDMPKEMVQVHLQGIKQMFEQKASINTGASMGEYNNAGPVENCIYIPTHEGKGTITVGQVGGDVDPKQLTDLEYFRDKFFSGTGIPKQFLNFTEDGAGFNGGASLSVISSAFAKKVKRLQQALLSALYDLFNIICLDRNLVKHVNNYTLHITVPVTQEEMDRRESQASNLGILRDTMQILDDVQDIPTRLKILKSLIQNVTSNTDISSYIQEEIDRLEREGAEEESGANPSERPAEGGMGSGGFSNPFSGEESPIEEPNEEIEIPTEETPTETETAETTETEDNYLPSFAELGINGQ